MIWPILLPGMIKWLKQDFILAKLIVCLNIFLFLWTSVTYDQWPSRQLRVSFSDAHFAHSVEQMYRQTLDPVELKQWSGSIPITSILRDHRFWNRVQNFPFKGDQVQIESVREKLMLFQKEYFNSPQYAWGLGPINMSPWAWVTYQFTHASFLHLISNMIILFLVLCLLEKMISPLWLVTIYLFGGFGGGISYLIYEGSGSMAVVGASASVYALMAFAVTVLNEKPIPWTYVVCPYFQSEKDNLYRPDSPIAHFMKLGFGTIYMPAFFIFPIYIMMDFVTIMAEPTGLNSTVAVSAHIGGAISGFILGGLFLYEKAFEKYLMRIWNIDPRLLDQNEAEDHKFN